MKSAELLCKELNWTCDSDPGRYDLFKGLIEPIVRLAQEDTIRETVKECLLRGKVIKGDHTFLGQTLYKINPASLDIVANKLIKEL